VERTGKGLAYASTIEVLSASADRRAVAADPACGGQVYAHVEYSRQLRLKGEVIQDAFSRIGRMPRAVPPVAGSPERGYRMRARLHASGGRLGFYREGTHELCDAAATAQLLPSTAVWIAEAAEILRRASLRGLAGLELAENMAGDERACHLELDGGVDPQPFARLAEGLTGVSAGHAGRRETVTLAGTPAVTDLLRANATDAPPTFALRRDVRAFFQGNRFLLEPLLHLVVSRVSDRPVVDLYAGVGLFGLAVAASGTQPVTLVEDHPVGGAGLQDNAAPFGDRVRIVRTSVEAFLASCDPLAGQTVVVDPPRTGLSREALAGLLRARPARLVYVSCDVATLARDARVLVDEGLALIDLSGLDLFPNTAHVESVAVFARESTP
jgi:23S rRNA (uracil1939-C5)-methyltransferase